MTEPVDPYKQAAIELETLPGGGPASVEKMVVQAGLEPHTFKVMQALMFGAYQELSDAIRQRDALLAEKPQWAPESDCCVFLGRLDATDLYWCWQGGWPTFIERYGNHGSEYRSMPWQALRQFEDRKDQPAVRGCWEAYERAKARNLPLDILPTKEEMDKLRAELADLRRDREAWDAVLKHGIRFDKTINKKWIAMWGHDEMHADPLETAVAVDPRDAVLALAKKLAAIHNPRKDKHDADSISGSPAAERSSE